MIFLKTRKSRKKILNKKMIFLKIRKSRKKILSKKIIFLKIRKSRKKILRKKAERQNSVVSPHTKLEEDDAKST